jgi:phosphoglycolate phosphatase
LNYAILMAGKGVLLNENEEGVFMQHLLEKKYQGIIFDLDGTLVDSLEDLIDSTNVMLASYGYPQKTYAQGRLLIGRGIRKLVEGALPEAVQGDTALLDEAEQRMKAEYKRRYTNKTVPYPGIPELLAFLTGKGIPFGVSTNKPIEAARSIAWTLFGKEIFVDVIGQQAGQHRKPEPTQTLNLAKAMGVAPADCIYMGDSWVDYETAVNAGMLPVLCSWGFSTPEQLAEFSDAVLIHSPAEIQKAF